MEKLNKLEKNWILYDVGNSAFTMLMATILPIYFKYLAENGGVSSSDYLAYWGYAASITTLIVAILGPIFGTMTDTKGYKKPIFTVAMLIGTISCISLGFVKHWLVFCIVFIIAKIGYSSSLIFYDSMLSDITTKERYNKVSSHGYAWGYIGSCIPFGLCIAVVLCADKIGISMETAMFIAFLITSLWWILMSLPLLRSYKQVHYVEKNKTAIRDAFARLGKTLRNVKSNKKVFIFLLGFFFYIDGVYTIIDMATAYGEALGLDSTGLLLALLVTQIVAFPFAILFGNLAKKYKDKALITVCIIAYVGIGIFAVFLKHQWQFWVLAVLVGMFQGGIQALSRSYFASIIPSEQSGEFFGLFDICGKGAAFMGTTLISILSQATGDVNLAVAVIPVLFVIGLVLFRKASSM
jgi:UMF1 family MFS transporter